MGRLSWLCRATLRARANGVCSVKYSFAGDTSLLASEKIWSFTISGITAPAPGSATPQTITFPPIADREYGPGVILGAKASSGLEITYKSLTPSVCYILFPTQGAAVQSVTPTPAGDTALCTVQASQSGDDRYSAAAPVTQSFNWRKAAMYITNYWAPTNVRNVPLRPLTSTSYVSNSTYFFTSSLLFTSGQNSGLLSIGHLMSAVTTTPAVCSVQTVESDDRTGGIFTRATVKMLAAGTCSITWGFAGTNTRSSATRVMSVVVSK